jgi:hypothetical protein
MAYVNSQAQEASILADESVIFTPENEADLTVFEGVVGLEAVKEGAVSPAIIPIKIIAPGWGSSAYYSKEVLQRDGPAVFKKGTHMYFNHATATEEAERPEGDINNIAAVFMEDAHWEDNGVKGPGLYSKAKVFSDYSQQVSEKGPYIGVSINAAIKAHEGTAEGKTGKIADKFVHAFSTDFVTKAGAGGAPIVPVHESAGSGPAIQRGGEGMTAEETRAFEDLKKANADLTSANEALKGQVKTLEAGQDQVVATATVGAVLRESGIEVAPALISRACLSPVMKEGKPDPKWVEETVALFGVSEGKVKGFGAPAKAEDTDNKAITESYKGSLKKLGVPEAGLEYAVRGF